MGIAQYKILVVDDNPDVGFVIAEFLSLFDYSCHLAADGVEALEKIGAEHFDAVITDVKMPRMDGITLTRELMKRNPLLPVLVMTGYGGPHSAVHALSAGASDCIYKPFKIDDFLARFQAMMRTHEAMSPQASGSAHAARSVPAKIAQRTELVPPKGIEAMRETPGYNLP
jgi:DNA-binding response OmpR family regulator